MEWQKWYSISRCWVSCCFWKQRPVDWDGCFERSPTMHCFSLCTTRAVNKQTYNKSKSSWNKRNLCEAPRSFQKTLWCSISQANCLCILWTFKRRSLFFLSLLWGDQWNRSSDELVWWRTYRVSGCSLESNDINLQKRLRRRMGFGQKDPLSVWVSVSPNQQSGKGVRNGLTLQ